MLRRPAQHAPRATPGLWRWASAGVLVGALGAGVAWAPARWLAQAVDGLSQGRVQLLDSTGTVWSGQARLRLTGGNASHSATLLPGLLQWNNRLGWNAVEIGRGIIFSFSDG